MPLSRLDNFLKNVKGNILYVSPNDLDATDSVDNRGNSMTTPFVTIQRALIEASRFSYQRGLDNDRFGQTTILLSPGVHYVDNRPGWIPNGTGFKQRSGSSESTFGEFDATTNFDILEPTNDLYKLNSVYGGVIIPRGCSIVGTDLRKTQIRPLYVPDPENDNIERSAIFRITGSGYFYQFSLFDADPNKNCYSTYLTERRPPNYSHHKLTCFEYADGVNSVKIDDIFLTYEAPGRTDLDMYYEKVGLVYGNASGRPISPNYPDPIDIQPRVEEYRIVGPLSGEVGITSIRSGNGVTPSTLITCTLEEPLEGIDVDTDITISGVSEETYNGTFKVQDIIIADDRGVTQFVYQNDNFPTNLLPTVFGATAALQIDTVTSASPYIFNISMRSVFGLCGMHADGSKAAGFKSMVVAQFTGISLQRDNNAFVRYNASSGSFDDSTTIDNISSNPDAEYKPAYENYHIKVSNDAFTQIVSCFAIGFSRHFVTESGGDLSVTNSASNFGSYSLWSEGFRDTAFKQDDVGYISQILPPRSFPLVESNYEFDAIDVPVTVSVANTTRLYLYNRNNDALLPPTVIQGYRIGAKSDETLKVLINNTEYSAPVVMPNTELDAEPIQSIKTSFVGRRAGVGNSITNSTISFTENHNFINGESVRILSDNARLPDGLEPNTVYFAITNGLNPDSIQLSSNVNDALAGSNIFFNNFGGNLRVESRVSDKRCGDIGHPVQWDTSRNQWYITVADNASNNLYSEIVNEGVVGLGDATARTFISRRSDDRPPEDRTYRAVYVLPSGSGITSARPPLETFIIQESSDVTGSSDSEVALQFNPGSVSMTNFTQMRNFSFVRDAEWSSVGIATYQTELPHRLRVGQQVKINNVTSTTYPVAVGNSGFNGSFTVTDVPTSKSFAVGFSTVLNPGTFTNNLGARITTIPTFEKLSTLNEFQAYDVEEIKPYKAGEQDGIYYLTIVESGSTPDIAPFNNPEDYKFSQPIQNLYPQLNRDNPVENPHRTSTYAPANELGTVYVDDPQLSITKQTIEDAYLSYGVGCGLTNIITTVGTANTIHTFYTDIDHNLNGIAAVTISNPGSGYGNATGNNESLYNAILVGSVTGEYATARITVDVGGSIIDVKIMSGGTNYKVGDILTVTGTATQPVFNPGTVTVTSINNNIGDTVKVVGVSSYLYNDYNQLYSIIDIPGTREIEVTSVSPVQNASTAGIGTTVTVNASQFLTGKGLNVSSLVFDPNVGLATVTTVQNHGLVVNNAITLGGATDDVFNGTFIVTNEINLTNFVVNVGIQTFTPVTTGNIKAYYPGLAAQDGNPNVSDETFAGRSQYIYAGITTTLLSPVTTPSITSISLPNLASLGLDIGDYLLVDREVMRIRSTVRLNPVQVFRGLFGSRAVSHPVGAVVRKIRILPIEFRRTSILRASGHTFEYMGFGPGNYSTALPVRQLEQPSFRRQLTSQSFVSNGGVNVYTGMNDRGDFYIGSKKISASGGRESSFDTPTLTITGEDITSSGGSKEINVVTVSDQTVNRAITVEGGVNKDVLSQFSGPVLFTEKVNVTGDGGLETPFLFLQGDQPVSRKISVGPGKPTSSGNPGDVVFNANPSGLGNAGWIYTIDGKWLEFGNVTAGDGEVKFEKVGIATDNFGGCLLKVDDRICVDTVGTGIGAGTTADGYVLNVTGSTNVSGSTTITGNVNITGFTTISGSVASGSSITALNFYGDGSGLTNLNVPSTERWLIDGVSNSIYPVNDPLFPDPRKVAIGGITAATNGRLEIGVAGEGGTDLYVNNDATFQGSTTLNNINSNGTVILNNTTSSISAGSLIANTSLSGPSIIDTTTNTTISRDLIVQGRTELKSYYEKNGTVPTVGGVATLNLLNGNTFKLFSNAAITQFQITNLPPADQFNTFTFTLRITQNSPFQPTIDLNNWVNGDTGGTFQVLWPGGLIPQVTQRNSARDIYTFTVIRNDLNLLYASVVGQDFREGVVGVTPLDGWTYDPATKTVTVEDNLTALGDINSGT